MEPSACTVDPGVTAFCRFVGILPSVVVVPKFAADIKVPEAVVAKPAYCVSSGFGGERTFPRRSTIEPSSCTIDPGLTDFFSASGTVPSVVVGPNASAGIRDPVAVTTFPINFTSAGFGPTISLPKGSIIEPSGPIVDPAGADLRLFETPAKVVVAKTLVTGVTEKSDDFLGFGAGARGVLSDFRIAPDGSNLILGGGGIKVCRAETMEPGAAFVEPAGKTKV
jgi:hypothetical protein